MRTRMRGVIATPMALTMLVVTAHPVWAEDCVPTNGVFSPGVWQSSSLSMGGQDDDGLSTLNLHGDGSFALTIDATGTASGGLEMTGGAGSVMNNGVDQSHMEAAFTIEAQLSGTGSEVFADGDMTTQMSGEIDVRGADGYSSLEEQYGTDEMPDFGNEFSREWHTTMVPTSANCNTAIGTFGGGQLEYNEDGTLHTPENGISTVWFAFKHGKANNYDDIEQTFVELMQDAEFVLTMDPIDTDVLAQFVVDMLAFDSMVASAEYCDKVDLGSLAPGNPAYQMLQSVMMNTMKTFVSTAQKGAYTTYDVINVASLYLQSASLGWRGANGACLNPDQYNDPAMDLFVQIEDVLITRYELASEGNQQQEMAAIAAAAYQFGMPRLIAEVEGR